MKSANGVPLRKGQIVEISANKVKEFQLPTNRGEVVDARHNLESLVAVRLDGWDGPMDFKAASLTVVAVVDKR